MLQMYAHNACTLKLCLSMRSCSVAWLSSTSAARRCSARAQGSGLHACTLPIKPVARHRGSTLGPATGQHQAHRRVSLGKCGLVQVTRARAAAAGHSDLGPPSSSVGHAALLRSATTAPQSAGHSAPRLGRISISVLRSLRASRRTAVRLSTRDLSCVFFVSALTCSLTHCPDLALSRSSSSAPT